MSGLWGWLLEFRDLEKRLSLCVHVYGEWDIFRVKPIRFGDPSPCTYWRVPAECWASRFWPGATR